AMRLVHGERLRVTYRMDSLDPDWLDAATRRAAYSSPVPPGSYTFSVSAAGSDGVWSNDVAGVPIRVLPPFWRTWWFLTLSVATSLGAGGLAYRRRVAALEGVRAARAVFARNLIDSHAHSLCRIA